MDGIDPEHAPQLIDDELGDEMDEYGYSGLDQVLDNMEEGVVFVMLALLSCCGICHHGHGVSVRR